MLENPLMPCLASRNNSLKITFFSVSLPSFTIAKVCREYNPIKKARKKKKSQDFKFNVSNRRMFSGDIHSKVKANSLFSKKSANNPPTIGAIPAVIELIMLENARYAVEFPSGANFKVIFPEANDTPAADIPIVA